MWPLPRSHSPGSAAIGSALPGLPSMVWGRLRTSGASPLGSWTGGNGQVGESGGEPPATPPQSRPLRDKISRDLGPLVLPEGAESGEPGPGFIRSLARDESSQVLGSCGGRLPKEITGTGNPPPWTSYQDGVPRPPGGRGQQQVPRGQPQTPPAAGRGAQGWEMERASPPPTPEQSTEALKGRRNRRRGLQTKGPTGGH